MGRTFASVRQALKGTLRRWERAGTGIQRGGRGHTQRVVAMAKEHGSESFYGFTDPFETAVFSAFVEMTRALEDDGVDP